MIAPITHDRYTPDQIPSQQLLDRVGNVGTSHAQFLGDIVRGEGILRQIEQAVNLAHRSVDAPLIAHVAPMQDEPFDRRRETA
jgi:hypothetical protein